MNDRTEILFKLYEEAMTHVRHLEEQRSGFASVLIAVAGGVTAFGFSEGKLHQEYIPGILLIGIGVFGLFLSWKQNEKICYHTRIAIRHRELIVATDEVSADDLTRLRENESEINRRKYLFVDIVPVGLFWSLLYIMILAFGVFVSVHLKATAYNAPGRMPPSVSQEPHR